MAGETRQRKRRRYLGESTSFIAKLHNRSVVWGTMVAWWKSAALALLLASSTLLIVHHHHSDPAASSQPFHQAFASSQPNVLIMPVLSSSDAEHLVVPSPSAERQRRRTVVQPALSPADIQRAKAHVGKRKAAYTKAKRLPQWPLRGLGYLYTHQQVVLLAVLPFGAEQVQPGQNVITIHDVGRQMHDRKDCYKLTLWVRVNGPEIIAGAAKAVRDFEADACHWEFWFDLNVPGEYKLDVKVLEWNAVVSPSDALASDRHLHHVTYDNKPPVEKYPNHVGFPGFNFDNAERRCSEVCSRVEGCLHWSTPALNYFQADGCELYFDSKNENATVPFTYAFPEVGVMETETAHITSTTAHGKPHGDPTSYHMGCGWSFWLNGVSPCLSSELDDAVFVQENVITLTSGTDEKNAPLCEIMKHETSDSGRWVKEDYPFNSTCPREPEKMLHLFSKLKHHDNLLKHVPDRPHCWFRENITSLGEKCFDGGCSASHHHAWKSPIQQKEEWYGMWKSYECKLLELMDSELQYCINKRQIVAMEVRGGTTAAYLRDYLAQRLEKIKFFDAEKHKTPKEKTVTIVLDTLNATQRLPTSTRDEWRAALADDQEYPRAQYWEERYWVESMFWTSERKPFCTAAHAQQINEDAQEILASKNYRKIAAFNLSAAFGYDSAAQLDGLHIIGPPMKMVITKVLHYVCRDHIMH